MLDDAEVDGFLMWLNAPGYRMAFVDFDPADNVGLYSTRRYALV